MRSRQSISYIDSRFCDALPPDDIQTIFEVGARYGDETLALSQKYPNAKIYSFECNPATLESCRGRLTHLPNISFFGNALGSREETKLFYPFLIDNNPGSSSFLRRIDAETTQSKDGVMIAITTGERVMQEKQLRSVDLLCMDVQGFELEVLKGFGDRLRDVRHVIMEEPALNPSPQYLPVGAHSKYIDAPDQEFIRVFMSANGFREIVRIPENHIEDNVLYTRQ